MRLEYPIQKPSYGMGFA